MTPLKLKLILFAAGLSYAVASILSGHIIISSMVEWSYTIAPETGLVIGIIPLMLLTGGILTAIAMAFEGDPE